MNRGIPPGPPLKASARDEGGKWDGDAGGGIDILHGRASLSASLIFLILPARCRVIATATISLRLRAINAVKRKGGKKKRYRRRNSPSDENRRRGWTTGGKRAMGKGGSASPTSKGKKEKRGS